MTVLRSGASSSFVYTVTVETRVGDDEPLVVDGSALTGNGSALAGIGRDAHDTEAVKGIAPFAGDLTVSFCAARKETYRATDGR